MDRFSFLELTTCVRLSSFPTSVCVRLTLILFCRSDQCEQLPVQPSPDYLLPSCSLQWYHSWFLHITFVSFTGPGPPLCLHCVHLETKPTSPSFHGPLLSAPGWCQDTLESSLKNESEAGFANPPAVPMVRLVLLQEQNPPFVGYSPA